MIGRVFKRGNFMAVCIPKELAFSETIQEVETERIRKSLGVCPLEEQTRDVMNGETRGGLWLFMIDSGNCILCLFSPRNRDLSLISLNYQRRRPS